MEKDQTNKILIIRLGEVVRVVLRKIWLMILVGALFAVGGYGVSTLTKEQPMYLTTTKLYVTGVNSAVPSANDLALGKQVLNNYIEVLKSGPVLEQVIENLELNMSAGQLKNCISVNIPAETCMLEMSVSFPDGEWAKKVADELVVVSATRALEVMGCTAPTVYEEAKIPSAPYNVNNASWIVFVLAGGVAGVGVSGFVILVMYFANNKFTNPYKISDKLRVNVLGAIPNAKYEDVAYQNFVSRLLFEEAGKKLISFVSACEKDNKYEFLQKVAEVLKNNGKKVILVDTNITNPSWGAGGITELGQRGLEEYLAGEVSLENVIVKKGGISYISCREAVVNAVELLDGKLFKELLEKLKSEYDYVFVDTAPVNYVLDTVCVAGKTETTILVVSGKTSRVGQAKEVIAILKDRGIEVTGAVLKDMKLSKDEKYMCKEFGKYFGVYGK